MTPISLGWTPDVPDFRDKTISFSGEDPLPPRVDLREPGLDATPHIASASQSACATCLTAILDWQNRKWTGRRLDCSAEFLQQLTIRTQGSLQQANGLGLRSILKTVTRYGAPPIHLCQSLQSAGSLMDRPELFGFSSQFRDMEYFRLDGWSINFTQKIDLMRCWLANGNPFLLGFAVPHNFNAEMRLVPFDAARGGTAGGSVCIVMGYDFQLNSTDQHVDDELTPHDAGAFLVRTCWLDPSTHDGYFWLPFKFVEFYFARDAWAISCPDWNW